jgi:hypothetical protein
MSFTETNHYVPQWYQRRFIPNGVKERKLHYLDLTPERVSHPDGTFHYRDQRRRLGPVSCFAEKHLYTLLFGEHAADVIEKRFFGEIDRRGADAVAFFSNYTVGNQTEDALHNLIRHLDAQKLRTPKGLDHLKQRWRHGSHQAALYLMGKLWQLHVTIWMEGVWEVLYCDSSSTKFIISDHPVTTQRALPTLSEMQIPVGRSDRVSRHAYHLPTRFKSLSCDYEPWVRKEPVD